MMLKAFSCAAEDNLEPLIVAISSFRRHNPEIPYVVYADAGLDTSSLAELNVEIKHTAVSSLMTAALDNLIQGDTSITRAVHIGHTTLTQDSMPGLSEVDMTGMAAGISSVWTFAPSNDDRGWYVEADKELDDRRVGLNERYFDTEFVLFNLEVLRKGIRPSFVFGMMKSRMSDESEFLNGMFSTRKMLTMPSKMNLALECQIHDFLKTNTLALHRIHLGEATLARFPGDVTPWKRIERFDRLSMQLPMEQYAKAADDVAHLLSDSFMADVRYNLNKCESYLGHLPWVDRDIIDLIQ